MSSIVCRRRPLGTGTAGPWRGARTPVPPLEKEFEKGGWVKILGCGIVESAVVLKCIPLEPVSLLVAAALQPPVEELKVWWCRG